MRPFGFIAARAAAEAVALLAEHGAAARILASGTDLLADFKSAAEVPGVLIDTSRVEELRGMA
jgi:carbon-monoxide dehydrogenase medium subunit